MESPPGRRRGTGGRHRTLGPQLVRVADPRLSTGVLAKVQGAELGARLLALRLPEQLAGGAEVVDRLSQCRFRTGRDGIRELAVRRDDHRLLVGLHIVSEHFHRIAARHTDSGDRVDRQDSAPAP